jgi:hypothetical protein
MAAIVTNRMRIHNAELFKAGFADADTTKNIYLFVGKPLPWSDDVLPDTPEDSFQEYHNAWLDMMSLKKIKEAFVSHVLPRYDYDTTGNTVYVPYDPSDEDIFNHPTAAELTAADNDGNTWTPGTMYCVTSNYRVYKCLGIPYDLQKVNQVSTVEPTSISTEPFTLSDGYTWKYMFTVPASEILKYVTPFWIPVKKLAADDGTDQWDVQANATDGEIDFCTVTNLGSGYTDVHTGSVVSATSSTVTLSNDGVVSGSDDTYNGATIFINNEAKKIAEVGGYDGSSKLVTIVGTWAVTPSFGATYEILPTLTITGNGSGAIAKPTVPSTGANAGKITSVAMIAKGSGYKVATVAVSGGGGSSAAVTAQVGPNGGHGSDAVRELGGNYIMMNCELAYNEGSGDFPILNDYRKIGLVRNVLNYNTSTIATGANLCAAFSFDCTLSAASNNLSSDEILTGGTSGAQAVCVESVMNTAETDSTVKIIQNNSTGFASFSAGEIISGATSGKSATLNTITTPEVEPFSGDVLWIENRRPVTRTSDQIEDIRIVIEF